MILTLCLCAVGIWQTLNVQAQQPPANATEQAEQLAARGNYAAADQLFATEVAHHPGDFHLLYNRALVNFLWQHDEAARLFLEEVAPADRAEANYQALLGTVLTRLGKYKEAVPPSQKAVELAPGNPEYLLSLGALYLRLKLGQHATEVYQQGEKLFPERPEFTLGLGVIQDMQAKFDAAIAIYRKVSEKYPRYEAGYLFLAQAYLKAGRPTEAEKVARTVLAMNPRSALAEYFLGEAAWTTPARHQEASTHVAKSLELNPELTEALVLAAKIELRQGDAHKAVAYLERAIAAQPHVANAYYLLGQAYERLGEKNKSQAALEQFHRLKKAESWEALFPGGLATGKF